VPIRRTDWTPPEADVLSRSMWTGASQVNTLAGPARWRCKVELPPLSAAAQLAWRGFNAALRGRANAFRLVAVEAAQRTPAGVLLGQARVYGDGQTGFQLILANLPANQTVMKAGQKLTAVHPDGDEQLVELAADLVSTADVGTALLGSPLRRTYNTSTTASIELGSPWALMRKMQPVGWGVGPLTTRYDAATVDCEEYF